MSFLDALGSVASIITALVAAFAYGSYRCILYRRVKQLEGLLEKKDQPRDKSLTLSQLAAALTLTEDQVIEAASRSKKVESNGGSTGSEYRFKIKE